MRGWGFRQAAAFPICQELREREVVSMQADPMGEAPEDLSLAGSVVDQAIATMMERNIGPLSAASALLGGAIGILSRMLDEPAVIRVLENAIAAVRAGELRELQGGAAVDGRSA